MNFKKDVIVFEKLDLLYVNIVVVCKGDKNKLVIKKLMKVLCFKSI